MLEYIYGENINMPERDVAAKALIEASDKYGLDNLKLAAELTYVQIFEVTVHNVADTILYSDAKNCGELKKAALKFLTEHIDEAVEKRSIGKLYQSESLTNELILAMSKRSKST